MKFLVIFLLFLLLLFGILVFLLLSKTKIEFLYDGKLFKLKIINGFLRLKFSFPENKSDLIDSEQIPESEKKEDDPEKRINGYKSKFKANKNVIFTFLKLTRYRIHFSKLSISLLYGCGDAAATGILYGVLWGMISGIYNVLNLYFNAEYPEANITPDFQNKKFDISVEGIFEVRLVHIIIAIIKIMFLEIKKNKQERGR